MYLHNNDLFDDIWSCEQYDYITTSGSNKKPCGRCTSCLHNIDALIMIARQLRPKDGKDRMIFAGKSSLKGSEYNGVLLELNMADSLVFSVDRSQSENLDIIYSDKVTMNIFDSIILGNSNSSAQEMTTYDLNKKITQMKEELLENPGLKQRVNVWTMEYHKKFSLPFASIFFAFLAFSIAFLVGKHNGQTIGLFVGIVICVLYWAMQILGQLFVIRIGLNSFWCIWNPNFLIAFIAIILSLRLLKK